MKTLIRTVMVLAIILLFVVNVFADNSKVDDKDQPKPNTQKLYVKSCLNTLNNLTLVINFWHKACIKSREAQSEKYKQAIFDIIAGDIRFSVSKVQLEEKEGFKFNPDYKAHNLDKDQKTKNMWVKDDKTRRYLKIKKRLFNGIKKSNSFGYQYRLLCDYKEILNDEIQSYQIMMADIIEFNDEIELEAEDIFDESEEK